MAALEAQCSWMKVTAAHLWARPSAYEEKLVMFLVSMMVKPVQGTAEGRGSGEA